LHEGGNFAESGFAGFDKYLCKESWGDEKTGFISQSLHRGLDRIQLASTPGGISTWAN
jgi:hypothetical protein